MNEWISVKDRLVVITGATSGIGKACAYLYAKNGANIVITGRRAERLSEISEKI